MNILMFTNTFLPIVGGVSESVLRLKRQLQAQGHRVLLVAPRLEGQPQEEAGVIRVAAVQNFNGSDFSWPVPIPGQLYDAIEAFEPDIVHSHHPFLLGDTASRAAETYGLPLVFTHHTLYEHYTHYVPGDSPRMQRFVTALATQYTWRCDAVIAPSESIRQLLLERDGNPTIGVVPSGVDTARFAKGDRQVWRERLGLSASSYVIGHVGRLAHEKNLELLVDAVSRALRVCSNAHFLVVGDGEARDSMVSIARSLGVSDRLHFTGRLQGQALIDAYHAMDVFAFASHSETQGMVVAEAMAAGLPVVAVAAPGIQDVVVDGSNGYLIEDDDAEAMADALVRLQAPRRRLPLRDAALATATDYDESRCAQRCLAVYRHVIARGGPFTHADDGGWDRIRSRLGAEWQMVCYRGRLLKCLVSTELSEHGPAWWPGISEEDIAPSPGKDGSDVDVSSRH